MTELVQYESIDELKKIIHDFMDKEVEILLNSSYGGFCLSEKAIKCMNLSKEDEYKYSSSGRSSKKLLECFKTLGNDFSSDDVKIVRVDLYGIMNGYIHNYDGFESITCSPNEYDTPIIEIL